MNKYISITCLIVFFAGTVFAQTDSVEKTVASSQFSPHLNILIHQKIFLNPTEYQYADGTLVSKKELKEILRDIPENKKLLDTADVCEVFTWIGATALVGGLVCSLIGTYMHTQTGKNLSDIGTNTLLLSFPLTLFFGGIRTDRYNQAVDNYNLSVTR